MNAATLERPKERSYEKVQSDALELSAVQRLQLANYLTMSVESDDEKEKLNQWQIELQSRIEAEDRGDITTEDGPLVLAQLREQLANKR